MGKKVKEEVKPNGNDPKSFEELVAADLIGDSFEDVQGSIQTADKLGVHQRIITAVQSDKEYRQVLLTAAFDNKQEALLASDAITERIRYGVDITPIIDRVIAQCAVKGMRVETVLNSMNSYTLHSNYGGRMPDWKKKQDNKTIG